MMKHSYCGPPGVKLRHIMKAIPEHNALTWFNGLQVYYTHKARTAIDRSCELLRLTKSDEVLVPSYNCGSEVDPFMKRGIQLKTYRITKKCEIDIDDVRNKISAYTKVIYVTHYFGYPHDMSDLLQLCKDYRLFMIEDCALSLFSSKGSKKLGTYGDISVFSFPKSLSVPDGGALLLNSNLLQEEKWERKAAQYICVAKSMTQIVKSAILRETGKYYSAQRVLRKIFREGREKENTFAMENGLYKEMPDNYYFQEQMKDRDISSITKSLLKKNDYISIINNRRKYYELYMSLLMNRANLEVIYKKLPEGVCPLYFPIIVNNRDQVCHKLNERLIHAIPWWAGYHRAIAWTDNDEACYLKDNVLALPVHQDMDESGVRYVANCVIEFTR